jgi:Zn-dependent M28 family amino/carboxypeptidase
VDAGRRPAGLSLGAVRASLRIPLPEARRIQARNVVGFLPGSDPALRDQWLLIGAHHDHLGVTRADGDTIYNGADDNASGVAGMLALAHLFARHGAWQPPQAVSAGAPGPELPGLVPLRLEPAPRRSLVFAAFSAEEQGLWGSQELARQLAQRPAGTGRLVRMLNLDMIGRNPDQPVQVLADDPDEEIRRIVEAAAAAPPPRRVATRVAPPAPHLDSGRGEMTSDHAAFYRQGVQYLFFFTGLHPDYHGLDDEADRLSYPRLAEVVALAWRVASLLADAP